MTNQELLNSADRVEVSTEELRVNLADLLNQVRYANRLVVVKKYNTDAAIIISPRMFQRILDSSAAKVEDRQQAIHELRTILNAVPANDPDTLNADINKAIAEVRTEKRKKKKQP